MDAQELKQFGIFMPYAMGRLAELRAGNKRVVHYSSADNILNIISSQTMWMRNTRCMSDYSEVEIGYGMLSKFFHNPPKRDAFYQALNAVAPSLADESVALFDQWWTDIWLNTYVCSVSEHEDREDQHARLSMWRAFGQGTTTRAAMVMRVPQALADAGVADAGSRVVISGIPIRS